MTPDAVLDMPIGMRAVFDEYQKTEIRERNKANRRR